jgi:hypothetical protein
MVDNISFIPKKESVVEDKKKIGKTIDIYLLISSIIFFATVVSAIGAFLYKGYLNSQIEDSIIILEREKGSLDTASIKILSTLDKRIKVSEKLIEQHVDMIGFFDLLEISTLESIQFTSLDLIIEDDFVDVSMGGVADSYASIALQSDAFSDNPAFGNPIFSDLVITRTGEIEFGFSAQLDKNFILSKNRIE